MTDKLPPLSTPIALPSQSAFSPASSVSVRDVPRKQETIEEEPYTIRCICGFPDDDGNTIFCETCETWQHIECYYPDNVEDALRPNFTHSCAECEPRSLDRQQAIARQRARAAFPIVEAAVDRKTKRPPSKSQKKKQKPSELQINGVSHGSSEALKHTSPQDNVHPAKKPKSSHKPSQSVSSSGTKRSPSHGNAKPAHGHPLSPATTPPDLLDGFEPHNFSSGFLSLYNDQDFQIVNTNSFADLRISNTMSAWLRDEKLLYDETGVSYDVFRKLPPNIDAIKVTPEVEQNQQVIAPNTVVQWRCLRAPSAIEKDVPLIEVNGQIGFQAVYCADPQNRWAELTAPLPFVLFHPDLPLYIDTRKEGSAARFVRRSCKPNAVLETYISAGSEYHFWLVSDRPIAAKEQITISWDNGFPTEEKTRAFQLLGLADDINGDAAELNITDEDYLKYGGWARSILSEHGGCACNLGPDCAFARFHRNYLAKAQARVNPPKPKKRKPKTQQQQAISPTSTGHATNSRAASEGRLEDIPEHDRRSVSSSRSKPPSRDMTPTARQGSSDAFGILNEPSDRDKRKLAMVEDTFRRMEQQQQQQQQQQQHRKRKRASDGAHGSQAKVPKASSATNAPNLPTVFPDRGYVDAGTGTSRGKSGSPSDVSPTHPGHARGNPTTSVRTPAPARPGPGSATPRLKYCDAAVQTDSHETSDTATPKRKVGWSLRKRMLENWHQVRLEEEERAKRRAVESPLSTMSGECHGDQDASLSSPVSTRDAEKGPATDASVGGQKDIPMVDARPVSQADSVAAEGGDGSASNGGSLSKNRSLDLRVEMPPVPAFATPAPVTSPASTPVSAGPRAAQSPFSVTSFASGFPPPPANGVAPSPSPVKKKLSLSDYKSRMNKAAAARPSVATTILKPVSSADEPKSAASADGGASAGSPVPEKPAESGGS
ncbi:hypothetical protein VTH82DRAFT_4215 [Thermothelomyces myriococcoides]